LRSRWAADLGASNRASWCRCRSPHVGLVLGGSHHKTGTVLLMKVLLTFSAAVGLPFHKPQWSGCLALQRREPGVCFDEHASFGRLYRTLLDPSSAGALVRARLVHVVREPLEVCVSSYQYHLHSTEAWLFTPRDELRGASLQRTLRALDVRSGLLLECRRSIRDQILQQTEAYNATAHLPNVFTLRLEATQVDFDGSMRALFEFLLVPAIGGDPTARGGGVTGAKSGSIDGAGSAIVAAAVSAVARYDTSRHGRQGADAEHLSSVQHKRRLRNALLNETALAIELKSWRASVGYNATFVAFCRTYGFSYHLEAKADGITPI